MRQLPPTQQCPPVRSRGDIRSQSICVRVTAPEQSETRRPDSELAETGVAGDAWEPAARSIRTNQTTRLHRSGGTSDAEVRHREFELSRIPSNGIPASSAARRTTSPDPSNRNSTTSSWSIRIDPRKRVASPLPGDLARGGIGTLVQLANLVLGHAGPEALGDVARRGGVGHAGHLSRRCGSCPARCRRPP